VFLGGVDAFFFFSVMSFVGHEYQKKREIAIDGVGEDEGAVVDGNLESGDDESKDVD
jgi:hypothetical protein